MNPPPPPRPFRPRLRALTAGTPLVRVAIDNLGATEFAVPSVPRRFAPFCVRHGMCPVLYAGNTARCALAETVFHNAPDDPTRRGRVPSTQLLRLRMSLLTIRRDLMLADLTDDALGEVGVTRTELISAGPACYPATAAWGAATHAHSPGLDGIIWNSRRISSDLSMILFGTRVRRRADLDVTDPPLPLSPRAADRTPGYDLVLEHAAQINVEIVT